MKDLTIFNTKLFGKSKNYNYLCDNKLRKWN